MPQAQDARECRQASIGKQAGIGRHRQAGRQAYARSCQLPALQWQRLRDRASSFDIATASFAQAPVLSPVVFWRMAPLSDAGTPRSTSPEGFAYVPDRGASGLYSAQAQVVYPHIIQYWLDQDEGRGARSTLPTSQQWPEAFAYVANH